MKFVSQTLKSAKVKRINDVNIQCVLRTLLERPELRVISGVFFLFWQQRAESSRGRRTLDLNVRKVQRVESARRTCHEIVFTKTTPPSSGQQATNAKPRASVFEGGLHERHVTSRWRQRETFDMEMEVTVPDFSVTMGVKLTQEEQHIHEIKHRFASLTLQTII